MFDWVASNQETAVQALIAVGVVLFLAAFSARALRGRSISIPRPSRSAVVATVVMAGSLALALFIGNHGAALKSQILGAAPLLRGATDWAGTPQLHPLPTPAPAAPAPVNDPIARSMSELGCKLLLDEKRITISQVDTCITEGAQDPAKVYAYITGENLGASWNSLSTTAKQFALDKASADAKGPHQAAQQMAALNSYQQCETQMQPKRDAYIKAHCSLDVSKPSDITDYWRCSEAARKSSEYQKFNCAAPF